MRRIVFDNYQRCPVSVTFFHFGVLQLKLDLEEIKRLTPLAARQRIKGVLSVEMSRIEAEIAQLQLSSVNSSGEATKPTKEQKPAIKDQLSTTTIKTYGV